MRSMLVFPEASFVANKNSNNTNNSSTINSNSNVNNIKSNNIRSNTDNVNSNHHDDSDLRARMETLDMLVECTGSVWSWPGPWTSGQWPYYAAVSLS